MQLAKKKMQLDKKKMLQDKINTNMMQEKERYCETEGKDAKQLEDKEKKIM